MHWFNLVFNDQSENAILLLPNLLKLLLLQL